VLSRPAATVIAACVIALVQTPSHTALIAYPPRTIREWARDGLPQMGYRIQLVDAGAGTIKADRVGRRLLDAIR
jgi:hypothetical protein